MLARFHFALLDGLKPWQKILFWQTELRYPFGIADGFYMVQTTIDGAGVMFFLEVDDGNNVFDKVPKYLAYWRGKTWTGGWWAEGGGFPPVLVATPREKQVEFLVERSRAGEIFRVIRNDDYLVSRILQRR